MSRLSTTSKVLMALGAAALSLMLIGGLALLMLMGTDGDEDLTATAPTTTPPAVTTTTVPIDEATTTTLLTPETTMPALKDRTEGDGDEHATDYNGGDEWHVPTKPLPPMGIATTEFDWTVVELPLGEVEGDVFIHSLSVLDGRYVATVHEYDYRVDQSSLFVFESIDGIEWTQLPRSEVIGGHNIDAVFPFDGGLIATGRNWDEGRAGPPPMHVFITTDARSWTALDLSSFAVEGEMMWVNGAAGSDDLILLSGSREPYWDEPDRYSEPILVIEYEGNVLELNYGTNGYLITDAATGVVVLQGDMDRIYECCDDGLAIYDPATGAVLFNTGYENYHRAAGLAYRTAVLGEPLLITVESAGAVLTVDEFEGELTVHDPSGTLAYTGSVSDLWRGRPPTFEDPETDEVVLVIPWHVWEEAHSEMWGGDFHYDEGWYEPDPWLLLSADGGTTFNEVGPEIEDGWFGPVFHGPDGFAVIVSRHLRQVDDYAQLETLYVSADGVNWDMAVEDLSGNADWIDVRLINEEGLVGIFHNESDNRVATSATGVEWTDILTIEDLELPLGSAWFDQVTMGELGTIVTGNRHGWEPYDEPDRTFTKNGLTFTETRHGYELTDASGELIYEHRWNDEHYDEYEAYEEGAGAGLHWGEGGVVIFAEDGTVIFAVSHEELESSFYSYYEEPEFYYEDEPMVLFRDGGEWAQVPLPEEIGQYAWFSGILVGVDEVIMSTSIQHEPMGPEDYWHSVAAILVGSPR